MDADGWKTVISVVSAVIAVVSAYIAHRAKIQTRSDIFENQRDALILSMADNDNRCSYLALQCAFVREELERVIPSISDVSEIEQATALLGNVAEIEQVTKSLDGREYHGANLDALKYSENVLSTLRRMARGEQVNAKHLTAESYDLAFTYIKCFVSRQRESAARVGCNKR